MMEPADWGELHGWFEEMLSHHGRVLRDDIESSVARLLAEHVPREVEPEEPPMPPPVDAAMKSRLNALTVLTVLLSFLAATFFWLQFDMRNKWRAVSEQNRVLLDTFDSQQQRTLESSARVAQARQQAGLVEATQIDEFVDTMEWTVNQFAGYEPGGIPLNDERLSRIDNLINRLRAIGFGGVIRIDSHVGDFCYVQTDTGQYELAPDDLPVEKCDRVGAGPEDAMAMSAQQSVGFANYVAALNMQSDAGIQIEVDAHGNSNPSFPYPPTVKGITASEWNRVASQNNRVQVSLQPDSGNYSADASTTYR
jgi:hypothetical protein